MGYGASVIVFAKAPRPGLVKTRMCPPLDFDRAAALYARMLEDVLVATGDFSRVLDLDPVLALHPPDGVAEVLPRVPRGFRVVEQRGQTLSERMAWAVAEAAAGGARRILVRGSDSPVLPRRHFERALEILEEHDIALSPDLDGGYGLIGLCRPWPGLFDLPMSTETVLEDTLARARELGASTSLLEGSFDLDRYEELAQLAAARAGEGASLCPRTLEYLDREALWPPGCATD
jgi:rSAM/selenodomain-associated transferase 1